MEEYRVNLDIYNGPMDLLLYLIRRDEVDIYDIPISSITEQYLKYVGLLEQLDPNMAGEFLVLAATLLEIKTRMLLPAPPPEEGAPEGLTLDPRMELVRQLLEYRAFKDAAGDLRDAAAEQSLRFPRKPEAPAAPEPEMDLEDVQIWDLVDAFSKLMDSIGQRPKHHEVIYDDTPIELHQADILDRLQREGRMTFASIFEGRTSRGEIVGLFLAVLELVRQKKIMAAQDKIFGEICVYPRSESEQQEQEASEGEQPPESPAGKQPQELELAAAGQPQSPIAQADQPPEPVAEEPSAEQAGEGEEQASEPSCEADAAEAAGADEKAPPRPQDMGRYVSQGPQGGQEKTDDDDHGGTEDQGSGA